MTCGRGGGGSTAFNLCSTSAGVHLGWADLSDIPIDPGRAYLDVWSSTGRPGATSGPTPATPSSRPARRSGCATPGSSTGRDPVAGVAAGHTSRDAAASADTAAASPVTST